MKSLLSLFLFTLVGPLLAQSALPTPPLRKAPITTIRHKSVSDGTQSFLKTTVPTYRTCHTTEHQHALEQKYQLPSLEEYESKFKEIQAEYLKSVAFQRTSSSVITIPVIVHVVHNNEQIGSGANISQAQVISQIDVLNEDFRRKSGTNGFNDHPDGADIEIEFVLATRDESGNLLTQPGIHRVNGNKAYWDYASIEDVLKPQTIWNPKKYLNIWTVAFGGESSDLLGYAQFPSLSGLEGLSTNGGPANTDGVVVGHSYFGREGEVVAPYNKGRTATHEVGHWLGLRHIWGDGDCSEDDFCEDTPRAGHPNYHCSQINSCESHPGDDMIENYMDYTPDACMNVFTQDQKTRILTVMNTSPRRKELATAFVEDSGLNPIAYFDVNSLNVCSGDRISFTDKSLNNPTSWKWTFFDGDNKELVSSTNQSLVLQTGSYVGVLGVRLIVSNQHGSDTIFAPNYITVVSNTQIDLPFNESFENVSLEDWINYNPNSDRKWRETNVASSGGSWSIMFDNYSFDSDPSGTLDALISPPVDVVVPAYLSFDVAYATFGGDYSDTLGVYISVDCGATFYEVWKKGGAALATAPSTQESFVPKENEWVREYVPINGYGYSEVHIAIINHSGWGNNMYLDNIQILHPEYNQKPDSYFYTTQRIVSVGSKVHFWDATLNYPMDWSWTFEGGTPSSSSLQNPVVVYNTPGTYDVRLTTWNRAGSEGKIGVDYITVVDRPTVSIAISNEDVCFGEKVLLTASGATEYEWYDDRGYLVALTDTFTVYSPVSTSYSVIGMDIYGGSDTAKMEVKIAPCLKVQSNPSDLSVCENETVTLSVSGANNYEWYNENDELLSAENTLEVSLSQSSLFKVIGYIASGESDLEEIQVTVFPLPEFDLGDDITINDKESVSLGVTPGFSSYMWKNGATSQTIDILGSEYGIGDHEFWVEVTNSNGCTAADTIVVKIIESPLSNALGGNNEVIVYPVPMKDYLQIDFKSLNSKVSVQIFDIAGTLHSSSVITEESSILDTSFLPAGVYLIRLVSPEGITELKIVKY